MAFIPKNWRDSPNTSTPITADALEDLETRVTDYTDASIGGVVTTFFPEDYGALGDGVSDDTQALQDCIDAALLHSSDSGENTRVMLQAATYLCDEAPDTSRHGNNILNVTLGEVYSPAPGNSDPGNPAASITIEGQQPKTPFTGFTSKIRTTRTGDTYANGVATTIADGGDGITNSQTTIGLASLTGLPTAGFGVCQSEVISWTGKSVATGAGNLTGCTRAKLGSTAATHAEGVAFTQTVGVPCVMGAANLENGGSTDGSAIGNLLPYVGEVRLRNFIINVPDDPDISGVDCSSFGGIFTENVRVEAETASVNTVSTTTWAFGIRGPQLWGTWRQKYENTSCRGFQAALVNQHLDHSYFERVYPASCVVGFAIQDPFMGGAFGTAGNAGYVLSSWVKYVLGGWSVLDGAKSLPSPSPGGTTNHPFLWGLMLSWEEGAIGPPDWRLTASILDANNEIQGSVHMARFNLTVRDNIGTATGGQNLDVRPQRWANAGTPTQVASVASLTIPPGHNFVQITGSTSITSITASHCGREVTLHFSSTAQVTDGSNIKLAGSANFTGGADRVLRLICDGTNWLEVSRAAN